MNESQNFAYLLLSYTAQGDLEIVAVGESARALIEALIDFELIDAETMVNPLTYADGKDRFVPLGEHLPNWKKDLPLLTRNEFNEWFKFDYRIDLYPMMHEKKENNFSETP